MTETFIFCDKKTGLIEGRFPVREFPSPLVKVIFDCQSILELTFHTHTISAPNNLTCPKFKLAIVVTSSPENKIVDGFSVVISFITEYSPLPI